MNVDFGTAPTLSGNISGAELVELVREKIAADQGVTVADVTITHSASVRDNAVSPGNGLEIAAITFEGGLAVSASTSDIDLG